MNAFFVHIAKQIDQVDAKSADILNLLSNEVNLNAYLLNIYSV